MSVEMQCQYNSINGVFQRIFCFKHDDSIIFFILFEKVIQRGLQPRFSTWQVIFWYFFGKIFNAEACNLIVWFRLVRLRYKHQIGTVWKAIVSFRLAFYAILESQWSRGNNWAWRFRYAQETGNRNDIERHSFLICNSLKLLAGIHKALFLWMRDYSTRHDNWYFTDFLDSPIMRVV